MTIVYKAQLLGTVSPPRGHHAVTAVTWPLLWVAGWLCLLFKCVAGSSEICTPTMRLITFLYINMAVKSSLLFFGVLTESSRKGRLI